MRVKELIVYLLHFDMDAEVLFNDGTGKLHSVTNDDKDIYLGNGEYDRAAKKVKLMPCIGNCKPVVSNKTPDFTFQEGDYVTITSPFCDSRFDLRGIVVMVAKDGDVFVLNKVTHVSNKFHWWDVKKITKEEYYGEETND